MERVIVSIGETPQGIICKLREDGKISYKQLPFHNYFYVKEEDYDDDIDVHRITEQYCSMTESVDKSNGSFVKLILKNNFWRYKFKTALEENDIETFEADISAPKRFLIENQKIKLKQDKLEVVFLDIETDDRNPMEKDFNGNIIASSPITACAFKDMKGKIKFVYNKARDSSMGEIYRHNRQNKEIEKEFDKEFFKCEKELLIEIINYLKNYDLTLSWNGWRFDIPYIKQRCELHDLLNNNNDLFYEEPSSYEELMMIDIDYMEVYKKNNWESIKSYKLEKVSLKEFETEIDNADTKFNNLSEIKKVDWREKTGLKKFFDLYLFEKDVFKEYNIQDVNLMFLLEEKLRYMEIQNVVSRICHAPFGDTIHNSKSFDYAMLNEYYNNNLVAPSKPTMLEIEKRKDIHPSGGYTYVYNNGFHKDAHCFDYKSFYPCAAISFNMSPETFKGVAEPDLESVFSGEEMIYIKYCVDISKEYLDAKGLLNKKKYEIDIEEKRKQLNCLSMFDLMYKFIKNYKYDKLIEYCKKNNYQFTPADINYDTRGWAIHPHRVFARQDGIFPGLLKKFVQERDKTKYKLKGIEYHSTEWWTNHHYQDGLKVMANSGYGAFGFKSFRFFMNDICDSITTSCRYIMKKSILFSKEKGFEVIFGDTDSSYLIEKNNEIDIKNMDAEFYKYYKKLFEQYNTSCKIELTNPETKEKEINNHFIVFEWENMVESIIVIKKKRYYYKIKEGDKFIYETKGGAYKKSDTSPIGAEIQKELCKDILDEDYRTNKWFNKISEIHDKVFSYNLEDEHIIMTKGLNNQIDKYGGPVIDGKTGEPKIKKDGTIQQRPIPCHVIIAKRLIESGEEIDVGDKIDYIITESKPRQVGISLKEFKDLKEHSQLNAAVRLYDIDYYWKRIESPILEILQVIDKENVYNLYGKFWSYSKNQLEKLQEKMEYEDE